MNCQEVNIDVFVHQTIHQVNQTIIFYLSDSLEKGKNHMKTVLSVPFHTELDISVWVAPSGVTHQGSSTRTKSMTNRLKKKFQVSISSCVVIVDTGISIQAMLLSK